MSVTAKFVVTSLVEYKDIGVVAVSMVPDYQDGRNKEWAKATPSGSISLTIDPEKTAAAELFKAGTSLLITFERAD